MREHGGNIDLAVQHFGGRAEDWIDLSTGINRQPYPMGEVALGHWANLPSRSGINSLHRAAQQAYATRAPILAIGGAQAAIQLLPQLAARGRARILAPTYNEYGAALEAAGWEVAEVSDLEELAGADLAVVCNPNNPDGRRQSASGLLALLPRVGRLVVDESFADAVAGLSVTPEAGRPGLLVLRSFGKFYGLAGLRLGFVLGHEADIARLAAMAGPWPISGPAIAVGRRALLDRDWADATMRRLDRDSLRMDAEVQSQGWQLVGGTPLFRLYDTSDATAAQEKLGHRQIWSRVFARNRGWLRLGLPGDETEWSRLAAALGR
ncbi:threonine-phosphate decarboxylase [Bradyrhizobium jicamae]|uniref:threonine-phosphate decarboxylase n=1 Tax=Bradyrhizobium jicamae TaxID=280332 RepID=A0ABS5FI18_9BRAD|nr:threonine-phosphate decarboxylase CobD [Bradyrhizobium jicamae]MBR0796429.1 threonine-phosphate decarboxylase [Bradyrhizobium jicamae]